MVNGADGVIMCGSVPTTMGYIRCMDDGNESVDNQESVVPMNQVVFATRLTMFVVSTLTREWMWQQNAWGIGLEQPRWM